MESRLLLAALRVVARRMAEDIFHRGGSEYRGDDISRLLDWRDVTVVMICDEMELFLLDEMIYAFCCLKGFNILLARPIRLLLRRSVLPVCHLYNGQVDVKCRGLKQCSACSSIYRLSCLKF